MELNVQMSANLSLMYSSSTPAFSFCFAVDSYACVYACIIYTFIYIYIYIYINLYIYIYTHTHTHTHLGADRI